MFPLPSGPVRAALRAGACAALCAAAPARAQDSIPEFVKLRTPSSPAFVLLGTSPATAERPTTPRAVAVSLLDAFAGQDALGIPKQFALEVAPYWLASRPRLTVEDYSGAGPGTLRNVGTSIARTLSVAVAANEAAAAAAGAAPRDTSVFRVAGSVRFSPFRGRVADTACVRALRRNVLDPEAAYIATGLARLVAQFPESATVADWVTRANLRLQQEWQAQNAQVRRQQGSCADALAARTGFLMDVAGGLTGAFADRTFGRGRVAGWALWATPTWAPNVRTSLVGVGRLGAESGAGVLSRRYADLGGRGVRAWGRYALSLEGVWRSVREAGLRDDLYRATVNFDVEVAPDLWLNAAFGRDFRAAEARSVVALANLQWHFGDRPAVEVPAPSR